jgi:hypothetical protein
VDGDGRSEYSKTVRIIINRQHIVKITQNPVGSTLSLATVKPFTSMDIIDVKGRIVKRFGYNASQQYDLSTVSAGVYFVRLFTGTEMITTRIIKY